MAVNKGISLAIGCC